MLQDTYKHKGLRNQLVTIIKSKGISNRKILEAIGKVPRHLFMDSAFLEHSYQDKAFAIGEGQTISQPYTVAFQTQLLEIEKNDNILEIGTGSGYQAAILLELGINLTTIEFIKKLYLSAKKLLTTLNYRARFVLGDGSHGYRIHAPYDKIIVTAGVPSVPTALINQLTIGGILIIPVGGLKTQKMMRFTKLSENKVKKEEFGDFSFVKLKGEKGWGK